MAEKGKVANNSFFRDYVSNPLDNAMGWTGERKEGSGTRGVIHGVYHGIVGCKDFVVGRSADAKAEFSRSKEQFSRSKNTGSSPPKK